MRSPSANRLCSWPRRESARPDTARSTLSRKALMWASSSRLCSFGMPLRSVMTCRTVPLSGRLELAELEGLDIDAASNCFALKNVDDVAHLQLVVGDERDLLAVDIDTRLTVLEIEAILDLLARLIEGVVEFLPIDARNDVERGFARHGCLRCSSQSVKACSTTSPELPSFPTSLPST